MLKVRLKQAQTLSEPLIPSIPTTYRGVLFRSRLEVKWARVLTNAGHRWVYEKDKFVLPSGCYIPDFWLPDLNMWAEVKPEELNDLAKRKLMELTSVTGFSSLRFEGHPHLGRMHGYSVSAELSDDNYVGVGSMVFHLSRK